VTSRSNESTQPTQKGRRDHHKPWQPGQVTDWLAGCRRDEAGKHTRGSAAANESQARETQTPLGAAGYLRRTE
jgi:hypothetical protein